MMENHEIDLSLALQMQAQFDEELRVSLLKAQEEQSPVLVLSQKNLGSKKTFRGELEEPPQEKLSVSLVDPSWELIDPNPDIHTLFLTFNNQFFWGRLSGIEVRWSPRMTLCAGVCCYEGRGGLCSVRLSLPLLKLRPRKDLVETLLHEMIHAYLFVTANNRDRDGHGPEFHKHMYRINGVAGTKISVYHSFHDEVDVYRQHIWQCNGPCRQRRPYFGLVKRAMNRPPGPRDPWWQQHQQSCGGTYTKIQEPEGYGIKKRKNGVIADKETDKISDIRKYFGSFQGKGKSLTDGFVSSTIKKRSTDECSPPMKENIPGYSGKPSNLGNLAVNKTGGNTGTDKMSNVHGFGRSGAGAVKHVNVSNASHSRVHGFGKNSPMKKKPRVGSGASSNSTGSSSNVNRGSSHPGSSLAVRTGGGSKTVTVKGKTVSKTPSETPSETENANLPSQTTVFQGQGYALGGGSGVSRLLSLSSSSSASGSRKDNATISKKSNDNSRSQVQNLMGKCPVCSKDILEAVLDKHISDCIGDFDDDDDNVDDWSTSCPNGNVANDDSLKELDRISVSSDDSGDFFTSSKNDQGASSTTVQTQSTGREETFPCPVCGNPFTQAEINEHLDSHF